MQRRRQVVCWLFALLIDVDGHPTASQELCKCKAVRGTQKPGNRCAYSNDDEHMFSP